VRITVTDDGPGMSPREAAHAFDPFFSGREAGRGLGFGLCKCWRIVTAHGGRVEIHSQPRLGTTVVLTLPAVPPAAVGVETSGQAKAAAGPLDTPVGHGID
jgi:signal transduction histidine kinase